MCLRCSRVFNQGIQNATTWNKDDSLLHKQAQHSGSSHLHLQKETNARETSNRTNQDLHNKGDNEVRQSVNKKEHTIEVNEIKQARFLIAESEPEMLLLFKTYLDSFGLESMTVDNGITALETFLQGKNEGDGYDAVVLDTHLKGKRGLDLAKAIRERDKSQKIILVTTSMKEQLSKDELNSAAIDEKGILVMPFALSSLFKLLTNDSSIS